MHLPIKNRSSMLRFASQLPVGNETRRELLADLRTASNLPETFEVGQRFVFHGKPVKVLGGPDMWVAGNWFTIPNETYIVQRVEYSKSGKLNQFMIEGDLLKVVEGEANATESSKWDATDRRGGVSKRWMKALIQSSWM